ncbi:cytochrome P450 [Rhodococcus sp. IEGM 1366]|uniref:cytochrome P450 n=1 Tax=Rhodococcus sp. IEGM 1366 TaxID=3082223 RepID=UPI0029544F3A|nr:cytochrome P450 [Rhodococcus sp. IEGM 1366]MDV8070643.1 cytochrome P450 [Rhodococcus sp. IEGM 1366]
MSEDVFEQKDRFFGVGRFDDPYPKLAELQKKCPVHEGSLSGLFGTVGAENTIFPEESYVTVTAFDEVDRILKSPKVFSSSWYHPSMGEIVGRSILEMDPPEHRRFRALLQVAFSKSAVEGWEEAFIRSILNRAVDRFAGRGHADLSQDFAFLYPIEVTATAAGLPVDDLDEFYRFTAVLTNVAVPAEDRLRASRGLGEMVQRLIDERRKDPREDLISVLVQARLTDEEAAEAEIGDGKRTLSDEEIVTFVRLLVPAGAQTTYRAMTNLLYGLLTHPGQLDALRADRSLIPQAVEEGIRWEVPLTYSGRTVTTGTEVCGRPVDAGSQVQVLLGAVNRDPQRWPDAEKFDIFRPPQRHLGFGTGVHVCLGINLARSELKCALEVLLDRLPDIRLDPDADPPSITGLGMRTAARLPVVFTPS